MLHRTCSGLRGETGMSLLEVVVALTISAIIAGIGILNHNNWSDSFQKKNARQQLELDLRRARQDTMAEGSRGVVTISASGTIYTFGFDYAPYSSPAAIEKVVFNKNLPSDVTLSTSSTIIFDSRGQSVDVNGVLTPVTVTVTLRGQAAIVGTLYPIGYLDF